MIPKYYINEETNQRIINPRWQDAENNILAENTRILKVFIQIGDTTKVFPFIIDKIADKKDENFSVYKEITCNGLAFAELGKIGYKLELNSFVLEQDYLKDPTTVPTLSYWLDKVFPNVKDEKGNIIEWLTPWCYEIRMDWSYYADLSREKNKVYEESYISAWEEQEGELVPSAYTKGQEKARQLDITNSNKYNITQELAEKFEVFCYYEYKTDLKGQFIKTYIDDESRVWTGKKVIFYNNAIKMSNPFYIDYQKNLHTINRICDTSEIYTKLFVKPQESSIMSNGYISIADTKANPLMDEFILNFDYLKSTGSINEYQSQFIKEYEVKTWQYNSWLTTLSPQIETLTIDINDIKSSISFAEKEIASAKEQLEHYTTLMDNEVTNVAVQKDKNNPCSIIFVDEGNYYKASIHFEGVIASSISGYKDREYKNKVFPIDGIKLNFANALFIPEEGDNNFYLLLDEYGYAKYVFSRNPKIIDEYDNMLYLQLQYSPSNKYASIVSELSLIVENGEARIKTLQQQLDSKQESLDSINTKYNGYLDEKTLLNQKLERILGPALREGYWAPETYEDVQTTLEKEASFNGDIENNIEKITFDEEAFENEQLGYFWVKDEENGSLKEEYYDYIKYQDIYDKIDINSSESQLSDLRIHFQRDFVGTVQPGKEIVDGNHYILYNSIKYYFVFPEAIKEGSTLVLEVRGKDIKLYCDSKEINLTRTPLNDAANLSDFFEGLESHLGDFVLYNNAGFNFAFVKYNQEVIPILLITNEKENYKNYTHISYSLANNTNIIYLGEKEQFLQTGSNLTPLCYPRIILTEDNVNYLSDLLSIEYNENKLEKYLDYTILLRDGLPYITLKISSNNSFFTILNNVYKVIYQTSRASETLYLDAKQVAKENSQPKYSYQLTVGNLPDNINDIEIGQLVYINDSGLGIHAATGYISEITYSLQSPKDDDVKIQNYKTKFEDLFSTIAATNEAMRTNKLSYDMVVGNFEPDGTISGSVLQQSINNNNLYFNYSNTGVEISPTDGIILTNSKPYLNGVYGQVALQGGGIYLSDSIDPNTGERIWNTGITPSGINASLINAGQLNTNLIRIYSDDQMAFQWNGEGLYAYKINEETGKTTTDEFVRYSRDGLHYTKNIINSNGDVEPINYVTLDWNGLTLRNSNNQETLSMDNETGDLTLRGSLQSYNYVPGILGSGWRIDQDGKAEFNDVSVRGTISASVFKYDETTAVGGQLYVAPTLIVGKDEEYPIVFEKDSSSVINEYSLIIKLKSPFPSGNNQICGRTWNNGDVIGLNGVIINENNITEKRYEFKNARFKIDKLNENGYVILRSLITLNDNTLNILYDQSGQPIELGSVGLFTDKYIIEENFNLIYLGSSNSSGIEKEGILINAMDEYGPYIDIYGSSEETTQAIKNNSYTSEQIGPQVRVGDLTGLKDNYAYINASFPNMSGYGLYADNVYLRGNIYATGGQIGSLTIQDFDKLMEQTKSNNENITVDLSSFSGFIYAPSLDGKVKLSTLVLQGGILLKAKPNNIDYIKYNYQHMKVGEATWSNILPSAEEWTSNNLYELQDNPEEGEKYRAFIQYKFNGQDDIYTVFSPEYTYTFIENGMPAYNYTLTSSVSSVIRDLIIPLNPTEITFSLSRYVGAEREELPLTANGDYTIKIRNTNGTGQLITPTFSDGKAILNLENYAKGNTYEDIDILYIYAFDNTNGLETQIDLITIPFIAGDSLNELGKIVNGQVLVNDGKVYADAIVSDAITTRHISTGAIIADHISADAITADKIAAEAITSGKIAADAIIADKIAAGAITTEHISSDTKNGLILSTINSINIHNNNLLLDSKGPFVLNAGTNDQYYKEYLITSISGEEYVFSADVTVQFGTVNKITFELCYKQDNGMIYSSQTKSIPNDKRIIFQFIDKSADYDNNTRLVAIRIYAGEKGYTSDKIIELQKVQLEKGNIATAWSPHPDDPASALETSYISIKTNNIHLASGGTITMDSENFSVDAEGNVSLTGEITAQSGKISNWNIGTNELYSGSGTTYIALNSDSANSYAFWAGNSTAASAPFSVTKQGKLKATGADISGTITATEGTIGNWSISSGSLTSGATTLESSGGINVNNNFIVDSSGNVTLSSVTVQDENGGTTSASLGNYPLWAIYPAYNGRVTDFTSSQGDDGTVTLTIVTGKDNYTVNFKKATPLVPTGARIGTLVGGDGSENSAYSATVVVEYEDGTESDIIAGRVLAGNAGNPWRAGKKAGQDSVGIDGKWENGIFKAWTVYDPAIVKTELETSPVTLSENWNDRLLTVSAYAGGMCLTSETYDVSTTYNAGMDAAAATLLLYPDTDVTLNYGDSQTINATVKNSTGGVERQQITVSAPKDNYQDGVNSVTISSSDITKEDTSGTNIIVKAVTSNGTSATNSISALDVYNNGYDSGRTLEANSLSISPSSNTSLDYGGSVTVTAKTTRNQDGKSVKITAPNKPTITSSSATNGRYYEVKIYENGTLIETKSGYTDKGTLSLEVTGQTSESVTMRAMCSACGTSKTMTGYV